ncbi:MAG TPA: NADH-quinone oxidoreductase subunit N [Gammaproteobacteria bacterium]|nr:NADH-quinone oxidoreductase subunit N [Gammaproteobacteria bacterium]
MNLADLYAILPFDVMTAGTVIVLLVIAFHRNHALTLSLTLLTIVVSFYWLIPTGDLLPRQVTVLFRLDAYAWYYIGLLLVTAAGTALLGYAYFTRREGLNEEFYVLLLIATLGGMVLVVADHFASLFLGLELLSVSLFAMVGYAMHQRGPLEASIKYLVLAGLASGLLLFGLALVYVSLGTMRFQFIGAAIAGRHALANPYLLIGFALVVAGLGFKLSLVPFHLWTPDVYQGAPAPVTAFIATVSKTAVFALLLRLWIETGAFRYPTVDLVLVIIAMLSMLAGNLAALLQRDVKRILAYSSIAHLGYLLVPFLAGGSQAIEAVNYYLAAYVLTSLAAFGVVSVVSSSADGDDVGDINDYRGLFWRRPWLAGMFTLSLLSLAGIPFTAGFIAKFYALLGGVHVANWWLVFTLVTGSAIGLFYYLRIIVALYAMSKEEAPVTRLQTGALYAGAIALGVFTLALVIVGIYPDPLIYFIQHATTLI